MKLKAEWLDAGDRISVDILEAGELKDHDLPDDTPVLALFGWGNTDGVAITGTPDQWIQLGRRITLEGMVAKKRERKR